jgi:putative lipoprotein
MFKALARSLPLAALLLTACSPAPEETQPVDEAEPVRIAGEAFYQERILLPEGSWLEIEVIDEDREQVLAAGRLEELGAPPYEFEIEVEAGQWRTDSQHLLSLTLYTSDGSPRFSADVGLVAPVGELEPIRLTAVEGSEDSLIDPERWFSYRCGDVAIDVRFPDPDVVVLSLPWDVRTLDAVEAASGARYQDEDHEFWAKTTNQAMLTLPDADTVECRASRHLSPWTRAIERGVVFRAFGNEPGWVVELTDQPEPIIHLTLDYGTRELVLENVEILPDQAGVIARSPGNQARIDFIDEPCHDTMIGWTLPITVRMQLNEQTLNACGRYLVP